jgi:hypothetical protein
VTAGDGGRIALGHPGELLLDRDREFGLAGVAHRVEQRVTVGEVAVGGIGGDADATSRFAQHDGIRSALACEFDAGGEQRLVQVSVVIPDPCLARCTHGVGHGTSLMDAVASWTMSPVYDSVDAVNIRHPRHATNRTRRA